MSHRDAVEEAAPSERKFFGKHKWRGKLFSSEEKSSKNPEGSEQPENDLAEFLQRPGSNRSGSVQSFGSVPHAEDSPDSRLPPVSAVSHVVPIDAGYRRRKVPRRQGLRVSFDPSPPEIIGEGGDEAELPSIDIAQSRSSAKSRRHSQDSAAKLNARKSSPPPRIELSIGQEPKRFSHDDDDVEPPPLRRRSTGFHDVQSTVLASEAAALNDDTSTTPIERQKSLSSPESESDSEAFADIYAEYTNAPSISPSIVLEQSPAQPRKDHLTHKKNIEDLRSYSSLRASSPEFDATSGNSLTPLPSPQPFSNRDEPKYGYNFPTTARANQPSLLPLERNQSYQETTAAERPLLKSSTSSPATASQQPPPSSTSTKPPPKTPQISLRTVAKNLGGDALHEFTDRVRRFYGIFRLGASAKRSLQDISFEDWIMAGTWWFLKGRGELEIAVRGKPGSRDSTSSHEEAGVSYGLKQAYLNLAKATWITGDVANSHSEIQRYGTRSMASILAIVKSFGDAKLADLIEMHLAVTTSLRALTMSMKRNDKMPPTDFEAQGLDSRIWIETPHFASGTASVLQGSFSKTLLDDGSVSTGTPFPYPVGDTKYYFNYGNTFVDVTLKSSDDPQEGVHVPCIVSLLRERNSRDLEIVLASQNGKVKIPVQGDRRIGPTWRDVHWRSDKHCMILRLSDAIDLDVRIPENSFRTIWGTYDFYRKVRKNMEPADDEQGVFKSTVRCVHYVNTPDAKVFPTEPVQGCSVRLFENFRPLADGSGRRKIHDGHRLVVVTPPTTKTLSNISLHLGKQRPILFTYVRGDDGGPAILLNNDSSGSTLVVTFQDPAERDHFHSQLNGTLMKQEEICSDVIPLQSMIVKGPISEGVATEKENLVKEWRWEQLRVISRRPDIADHGTIKTLLSNNLRIWIQCAAGALVDRINLGPGEFQLSLSADTPAQITLLRPPQQDMTVVFASNQVSTSKVKILDNCTKIMSTETTSRTYSFKRLQDLHLFQRLVTGFSVLYDGSAANFSISRRRMVVPIYKRWEANFARLQLVQSDKAVQLVGFFKDFPHGTCMNFVVKTTDNFESLTRSEQFCIRIVDAKFAMPKKLSEAGHEFVCLDMPEYPSEHDDITIGFESEEERDRFGALLPAPVNKFSRLGSLRR